jgi:hypothetical protein
VRCREPRGRDSAAARETRFGRVPVRCAMRHAGGEPRSRSGTVMASLRFVA